MQNSLQVRFTKYSGEVQRRILGAAPVLSTEDGARYEEIWDNLIECFRPSDFLELLLIRQVQDETGRSCALLGAPDGRN